MRASLRVVESPSHDTQVYQNCGATHQTRNGVAGRAASTGIASGFPYVFRTAAALIVGTCRNSLI
jgi:hypothetical protein